MARANAASDPARAGTLQELERALTGPGHHRMVACEPWLRRLVPFMIATFMALLAIGALLQGREARDRAIKDAFADIELVAAFAAQDLNAAMAQNPKLAVAETLKSHLLGHASLAGRQIVVSDADGRIVASLPDEGAPATLLSDYLGPAQPLTIFAEKAGVMRITLADGHDALAAVRGLRPPLGQIAVLHPVSKLLADWRSASFRSGFLLFLTAFVLISVATAYFWQAARATETDRVHARVHARIDTALNRGRCGLWDWDLARGRVYWSASMYRMLGMAARSEFMSCGDVNALVHPRDGNLTLLAETLASSGATSFDHVFRLRNAQGEWVWLRARAELVREGPYGETHLVGTAVDISDEKRQAERNATADVRLRDAIEAVSEAFVLWDADNRLVTCNSKFLDLHDLTPEEVRSGAAYAELIASATPPVIRTQIPLGESPKRSARSYEAQLADGRWLQINERRTRDGGYVSVGTDITALKRHEEQLLDSERRLMATIADLRRSRQVLELQAQQLAELADRHAEKQAEAESANRAKSEFLANMSHELRTPLNAIIGFSELMEQEAFGPLGSSRYLGYASDIGTSGRYLLAVISDVLEMARLEAGRVKIERRPVDLGTAVLSAAEHVRAHAGENSPPVETDIEPRAKVEADGHAVERIVAILLGNAVKFTPPDGRVRIRVREANGALNIFVADSGRGMEQAMVTALGRPFSQGSQIMNNGMKGSGLGLAIARSLVAMHDGTLRFRSRLGQGTVALVHLPRAVTPESLRIVARAAPSTPCLVAPARAIRIPAAIQASMA